MPTNLDVVTTALRIFLESGWEGSSVQDSLEVLCDRLVAFDVVKEVIGIPVLEV